MAHQRMVEVTGASVFEVKGVQPSAGGSMTATLLSKSIVMIQIMADGRAAVLDKRLQAAPMQPKQSDCKLTKVVAFGADG